MISLLCAMLLAVPVRAAGAIPPPAVPGAYEAPGTTDSAFLEDLSRRSFQYFWEQADPATGLVADRARTDGSRSAQDPEGVASIASTGFGLSGLCIAAERGWVKPDEARERARTTLRFLAEKLPQEHGWFYHFVSMKTGERRWNCELSSIDTALLLGGVLTARQCFKDDKDIARWATAIYERVDFPWMLAGHPSLMSMGWTPEKGFIQARWDAYSEHMMLTLMAIGSPTHPLPAKVWRAWKRDKMSYGGIEYYSSTPPLFVHQYSHAYVDFRGRRDKKYGIDYFENSVKATRAHRKFCVDLGFTETLWGVTASDTPNGYRSWGGPPSDGGIDGSVVPCAAGGSLMFAPEITLPALKAMKEKFGDRIYGKYGFTDAFHPETGWVNPDVIGIDVGITLLSAENLRSGAVWRWFMANPEIPKALDRAGVKRK
ncbi:MAG: glucoamylase family protein [Elusimicrobiota bacterium]